MLCISLDEALQLGIFATLVLFDVYNGISQKRDYQQESKLWIKWYCKTRKETEMNITVGQKLLKNYLLLYKYVLQQKFCFSFWSGVWMSNLLACDAIPAILTWINALVPTWI